MAKISSELGFIESSVNCIKGQLKAVEDINPIISIVLDSVAELEKEVAYLRKRLEEEDMILK